ncbi:hypothetical protein INR49_024963 [Caranx melampygus]|nr:hypothetical protein INR49_024963 [Caranx melampygus]
MDAAHTVKGRSQALSERDVLSSSTLPSRCQPVPTFCPPISSKFSLELYPHFLPLPNELHGPTGGHHREVEGSQSSRGHHTDSCHSDRDRSRMSRMSKTKKEKQRKTTKKT